MNHPIIDDIPVRLDGVDYHTRRIAVTADWDRPWLVFLHEGLGSVDQWRQFPQQLASSTGRNAVVYDRRGHGFTGPLPGLRDGEYHQEEADILVALLEELHVRQCIPYGHSDGGTIALLAAATRPDVIAALVLEAAHVRVEEKAAAGIRTAQKWYRSGELRQRLHKYHGDHVDAMFSAWADTWLGPHFEDWSIEDRLDGVIVPTLVLQGEHDDYATPGHVDVVAEALGGPVETWLVPGAGHAPHREMTDDVIARVVRFLSGV
jgi:pimeloyl-ACP methyl ester carboxylesterase